MSTINAERNQIVAEIAEVTGFVLKRGKSSTTGQMALSNADRRANGLGHLLCNQQNFNAVRGLLSHWEEIKDGGFIPEKFRGIFDLSSVLYACGTAPRIKPASKNHVSKDAALTGDVDAQDFIAFAQAWRIRVTGTNYVGQSRSVGHEIEHMEESGFAAGYIPADVMCMDDHRPVFVEKPTNAAIAAQKNMKALLTEGGAIALQRLNAGKPLNALMTEMANRKAAVQRGKAAVPATTPATRNRGRGKQVA